MKPLIFFQIDQNTKENFNLTSDVEFNAIRSLVLGRLHSKWDDYKNPDETFQASEHSD